MEVGRFDDSGFMFEDVIHSNNTEGWLFHDEPPPPPPPLPLFQNPTTSSARPPGGPTLPRNNGAIDPFTDLPSPHGSLYPQAVSTSPTILAAASTLMRNGRSDLPATLPMNRLRNQFEDSPQLFFDHRTARDRLAFDQHSFAGHTRELIGGNSLSTFMPIQAHMIPNGSEITDRANLDGHSLAKPSLYGPERSPQNGLAHSDGSSHLQWGSDGNFANNQFFPPAHLETVAHVTDGLLERVQTFAERTSANSTQPPSPIVQRAKNDSNRAKPVEQITVLKTNFDHEGEDAKVSPRWRKRRKTRPEVKEEDAPGDEEEDWQEPISRRGKRQKRSLGKAGKKFSLDENHSKGRESESTEHRPGRDNLTEEQRRENHILSEQKRRNLIKQGFDDLSELVPGLKSGGFSKSAMLTQAVEWLESLLDGNARLVAQLGEMNRGAGL
ncbi:hypothetical protein MMC26_003805 [Xylographa opegraphella]|nr:hypothetical protein [Xylographa opegraphella]